MNSKCIHRVHEGSKIYKTGAFHARMANAIITLRVMPESPEIDLEHIKHQAEKKIDHFVGSHKEKQYEIKPVAFGLKSLDIHFMMNEDLGSPDGVADEIAALDGVQSCEVTNVTRAMG